MQTIYDCVPFIPIKETYENSYKVSVCAIFNRNFDLIDVIFVRVSIFFGLDTFVYVKENKNFSPLIIFQLTLFKK